MTRLAAPLQLFKERELVTTVPTAQKPRGVVFAFHGCAQYVTDFGFKSATCPTCHGAHSGLPLRPLLSPCVIVSFSSNQP